MENEELIKTAIGQIPEIQPASGFKSEVMRKIRGGTRAGHGPSYVWQLIPVPVTVVLLVVIALTAGNFVSVYGSKLKEYGAGKTFADVSRSTPAGWWISPLAVSHYCGEIVSKGVRAILGPAHITCFMDDCGEMAKDCVKKCMEKGIICGNNGG